MEIKDIKDLLAQFDGSSLREFSYSNGQDQLRFSKNEASLSLQTEGVVTSKEVATPVSNPVLEEAPIAVVEAAEALPTAEGDLVESPLVGVAYLAPGPDKAPFVEVGSSVKKGQTLMIIEAMKVMNEVPAPKDGLVTEILVANEDVIEFGQGLVRIK